MVLFVGNLFAVVSSCDRLLSGLIGGHHMSLGCIDSF